MVNIEPIEIERFLSSARTSAYQKNLNHGEDVLSAYFWNIELSQALVMPLHLLEVGLRNAISEAIQTAYQRGDWHFSNSFLRSLPRGTGYKQALDLERVRLNRDSSPKLIGQTIPELKFVFWEFMLHHRHNQRLWSPWIKQTFPFAPADKEANAIRNQLQQDVKKLRELRNRIAHLEPIFNRPSLLDDWKALQRIVGWRSPTFLALLNQRETFTALLKAKNS